MPASKRTKKGMKQWEADPWKYLSEVAGNEQKLLQIVQGKAENNAFTSSDVHQTRQYDNNNDLIIKDEALDLRISDEIVNKAGGKENILKAVQDEVQRHLLPYPNWQTRQILRPWMPHTFLDLLELYRREPVVFLAVKVLGAELFRKGILIRSKFWGKCDKCDYKYENKPPHLYLVSEREFNNEGIECEEKDCEGTVWPPDKQEKQFLENYIGNVNLNNQSLKDVCRELERDINVYDNLYLTFLKDYEYGEDGQLYSKIREVIRLDPVVMRFSTDERGIVGNYAGVCLFHRNQIIPIKIKTQDRQGEMDNPHFKCGVCGDERLYPVEFIAAREGVWGSEEVAYIAGEVRHKNRYDPSSLYGYSPLLVAWDHAVSLIDMTKYIKDYFRNRQIPRGMMFMPGTDKSVKKAKEQSNVDIRENPHNIPWFAIPASGDIKTTPQFVSFVNTLQELEYTQVRDEFRLRITGIYGVSPFMQNDVSQGGGLNSEGMQLTITNRAAEHNQGTWNRVEDAPGLFEIITNTIGVYDWELYLPPPEEKDLVAPLLRKEKKITIAEGMQRLGYNNQLPEEGLTDENDFVFTKRETQMGFAPDESRPISPDGSILPAGSQEEGEYVDPNDPDAQEEGETEEGEDDKPVTHSHDHPVSANSNNMHTHEHTHPAGHDQNIHAHSHSGQSNDEGKKPKPSSSDEDRMDGEPERPDDKATKQINGKGLARFIEPKREIKKIDPLDVLSNELYQNITNYYKQLIAVMIGGRFKTTPIEQLTQLDLMNGIVEMAKLSHENMREFGKNFSLASFTLGKLMADTDAETTDDLPSVTISGLLQAGGREDRDALIAYQRAQPFIEAFDSFSLTISNDFREIVRSSFRAEKLTLDELVSRMQDVASTETYRLDRIARSEVTRFSNEGRLAAYKRQEQDQDKKFNYMWLVTHDDRTSKQCQEIERRVPQGGLPWDDLYDILIEVQTEMMGPNWRPSLLVHPNCRSRPLRLVNP